MILAKLRVPRLERRSASLVSSRAHIPDDSKSYWRKASSSYRLAQGSAVLLLVVAGSLLLGSTSAATEAGSGPWIITPGGPSEYAGLVTTSQAAWPQEVLSLLPQRSQRPVVRPALAEEVWHLTPPYLNGDIWSDERVYLMSWVGWKQDVSAEEGRMKSYVHAGAFWPGGAGVKWTRQRIWQPWHCPRTSAYDVTWRFRIAGAVREGAVEALQVTGTTAPVIRLWAEIVDAGNRDKVFRKDFELYDEKWRVWTEVPGDVASVLLAAQDGGATLIKNTLESMANLAGDIVTSDMQLPTRQSWPNGDDVIELKTTEPLLLEQGHNYTLSGECWVNTGVSCVFALISVGDILFTAKLEEITVRDLNPPTGPVLSVKPDSLDFGSVPEGKSRSQKLYICNDGDAELAWWATENTPWITEIAPSDHGTLSAGECTAVDVNIDTSGLSDGEHSATIAISSDGGNRDIPVQVEVGPEGMDTTVTVDATPRDGEVYVYVRVLSGEPGNQVTERKLKFFGGEMPQTFKVNQGNTLRFYALSLSARYVGKQWDLWLDGDYNPQAGDGFIVPVNYDNIEATAKYQRQYEVAGKVTDLATGLGLSDATVSAGGKSTTTDSNGEYVLHYFPAGTYPVSASKDGYAMESASRDITVPPDRTGVDFTARDTGPPGEPIISSPTHPFADVWSSNSSPEFEWSVPEDPSGIEKYSYAWNQIENYLPGEDEGPPTTSNSVGPLVVADDGTWWFHVRAKDRAGNPGDDAGHYKINVDTTKPGMVSDLTGTSHEVQQWSNDNTIDVGWTTAPDVPSGVLGYSILWDHTPDTVPPAIPDSPENVVGGDQTSSTSPELDDSDSVAWYFHIRAVDAAGNAADDAADLGPFWIDTQAPAVISAKAIDETHVDVEFDDTLDDTSAEDESNYSITPPVDVNQAVTQGDGQTVRLTTAPLEADQTYTVTVEATAVADKAGNPVDPDHNSASFMLTGDSDPPYTEGHNPGKDATNVPRDTNIVLHVKDDDSGVDQASITMKVEGQEVAPDISGTPADYTVEYNPPTPFDYGQEVEVSVDAPDLKGNVMDTDVYSFTVEYQNFAHDFPEGMRMIGLPVQAPGSPTMEDLLGIPNDEVGTWDPQGAGYDTFDAATDYMLGLGYWARFGQETAVEIGGTAVTDPFPYAVKDGWNIISIPYNSEIGLESIMDAPTLRPFAWTWQDNGYEFVAAITDSLNLIHNTLKPWWGYWVLSGGDGIMTWNLTSPSAQAVDLMHIGQADVEQGGWQIQLAAEAGSRVDLFNYCGVADEQTAQALSIPNPPPAIGSVDLYFAERCRPMAIDIRPMRVGRLSWNFEVRCDVPDVEVMVSYPDLSVVPNDHRLTLTDLDADKSVYMRTTHGYSYNSGRQGGIRHFQITAEPNSKASLLITGMMTQQVNEQWAAIVYTLSVAAHVDIQVRNIAGRVVRQVQLDESQPVGANTALWNLTNATGSCVPAGTYLCVITARTLDGQTAHRLCTVHVRG